jgi:hypothetical protein
MEISKSFSYVFEDPRWVSKVAIGGAILLVGTIFSFLLGLPLLAALILMAGYMLTVVKNVAEGSTSPLPEWNDFGGFFMKGLYAAIGAIVIYIPAIVLICCAVVMGTVISSAAANSGDSGTSSSLSSAAGLLILCVQCLYILYAIVAAIYIYAPMTRYALNGQLSTFWDFRGNLTFIQSNVGGYILALIMAYVASLIGSLGFILCIIPGFFTLFWAYLVGGHIFGQFARGAPAMPTMAPMAPPPMAPTAPAE